MRDDHVANRRCIIAFVAAGAAVGCNDPAADAADPATPDVAQWSVAAEARIGSVDDPNQSLARVGQVVIGPDDRLYISQPMDRNIRAYDGGGALVNTIGRPGGGPGEFGQLTYIGLAGDTLYAAESGRVSSFSLDGEFLTSKRLTAKSFQDGGAMYWPAAPQVYVPLPDGTALVRPGTMVPATESNEAGVRTADRRVPLLRLDARSAVADPVVWVRTEAVSVGFVHDGTVFRFLSPFNDAPLFTLMPDGGGVVVVDRRARSDAEASTFRVTRIRPSGDTAFSRTFGYRPVTLQAEGVRRMLRQTRIFPADHANPPSASDMERALRDAGLVPATLMPVTALAAGQDGSIWLRREAVPGDSATWDVLDGDGRLQGTVRLPADQRVVAATPKAVATLETDALDVPYVTRYRLRRL